MNTRIKSIRSNTLGLLIFLVASFTGVDSWAIPTAVDDAYGTNEDTVLFVGAPGVLANDTGGGAGLKVNAVDLVPGFVPGVQGTAVSGATFTLFLDGSFTYNPNGLFENLAVGDSIQDGVVRTTRYYSGDLTGWSASLADIVVTVNGRNDAPSFGGTATGAITEDSVATVSNSMTISDVDDGEGGFIVGTTAGTYGSLEITNAAGAWTYTIDNAGGSATDQLSAGQVVSDVFSIKTDDNNGTGGATTLITITVTGANDMPVLGGTVTGAITEDAAASVGSALSITDADSGEGAYTTGVQAGTYGSFEITNGAGGWTYTISNATGSATDLLKAGEQVSDTFTVNTDDSGSAFATVTIAVTGANDMPVFGGTDSGAITEDDTAAIAGSMTILDTDQGEAFFVAEIRIGAYGSLEMISPTGAWTYTLDNTGGGLTDQLSTGETANDTFNVNTLDGGSTTATITITVTGVNDTPGSGINSGVAVDEGALVTISSGMLFASDIDDDASQLTVNVTSVSTVGALRISGIGTTTFTLDDVSNSLVTYLHDGTENFADSFDFSIVDGGENGSSAITGTFNITVNPVNDNATVVLTESYTLLEGATLTGTGGLSGTGVLGNDTDSDLPGDTLVANLITTSSFGSLTLNANGGFTYVHDDSENFSDFFQYQVNDGVNDSAIMTVSLTIIPVNENPTISDQTVTIAENLAGGTFILALGAIDDDTGDTVTYAITAGMIEDEFQVNGSGDLLVGEHTQDLEVLDFEETSLYTLTLMVTDSSGLTDTATIIVNISDENDPPGVTMCEHFDEFGVSLGVLDAAYGPIKYYYNFTAANPCHRIVDITDDYYMEQGKKLIASDVDPLAEDTGQINYRVSLNNIEKDLDQDSSSFYYTGRQNVTDLLAVIRFEDEWGTSVETGEFIYTPPADLNATDGGVDYFVYRVCDDPVDESEAHCALGIVFVDASQTEEATVSTDGSNLSDDLAQGPLELPVASIPNVFVLLDDSGSMGWDILTEQSAGKYYLRVYTSNKRDWFLPGDGSRYYKYAYTENRIPGRGVWRVRNSKYNKIYYDPAVTYRPWIGVDNVGNLMVSADPTSARSDPYNASSTRYDLTVKRRFFNSEGYIYWTRYYIWNDINSAACPNNVAGELDATPSPVSGDPCAEGTLVEIKPSVTSYPKAASRADCAGTVCTYDEEIRNYANFYSYARTRHYAAKNSIGKVLSTADNMRIGYGAFNSSRDNLNIVEMNESAFTGNKGNLLRNLHRSDPSGSTPMRRSLEKVGRYYACETSNTIISTGRTCPILPAPEGNCQQNFTLLIGDGNWNGWSPGSYISNADASSTSLFDGGRYADTNSRTLADVAMYFYENDLSSLDDEVPANAKDLAGAPEEAFGGTESSPTMHQHMSTFVISFGVSGVIDPESVPFDYTQSFNWGNVNTDDGKLDDMLHAAINGRGEYLNANNPEELSSALSASFEQFTQAIGSASAVSFNSQEVQAGALIYRAFYNIRENTGDLIAQEFSADGTLSSEVWSAASGLDDPSKTYSLRNILSFDPTVASGAGGIPFRFANLTSEQKLALEDDPTDLMAENSVEFDTQIAKHINYLRGDASSERPFGNLRERPSIKGRLGDVVNSKPVYYGAPAFTRRIAPPYSIAKPYTTFASDKQNRRAAVYIGANDGMLHAFDADDGEEIFAFMPDQIITGDYSQRVKQLLSTDYAHRYSIDLSVAINDVFVDPNRRSGTIAPDKDWATILIGGYRGGGKGYFALDVTDPDAVTEANAGEVVMWEFTDEDDVHPTTGTLLDPLGFPISDIGFSYSTPTISMSNVSDTTAAKDNEWVAVFGNGYNSTSGKAVLYVLFVGGGTDGTWCHPDKPIVCNGTVGTYDFVKIETPALSTTVKNGLGTPRGIDLDGNGTMDIAYAGDRFGNLYRFDLRDPDPSNWNSTLIAQATYGLDPQPIVTQPLVATHPTVFSGANCYAYNAQEEKVDELCGGYIVIFGTGSYIFEGDDTNSEIQSLYGVWDRLGNTTVLKSDLVEQEFTAISGDANVGAGRVLSENPVDYATKSGWYINFDHVPASGGILPQFPGEKAIRNIQMKGGIVFVNSVMPKSQLSCSTEAGGAANAFCPHTGNLACSREFGVFDTNKDGIVNADDLTVIGEKIATVFFEENVPTDSTFFGGNRVTQLSDQTLEVRFTDTNRSNNTGRISWERRNSN